ncbi:hypothetical protein LTR06_008902 [Exophiala xenobiotica]|nr:hypothetical protein LTR06_008902 [Exophiala xenobiotica]
MTPDNWVPRSGNLVRLTGQHPFNGEPRLEVLFQTGLITPNILHYVRNHGSVPRLYWNTHTLDVCDGALKLSMDDLQDLFQPLNIPVAMGCDGNRRGELNLLKKSKGFNWGPCAISCAYWKGALLWQVLEKAGVKRDAWNGKRQWVNFQGADEPSEGKYETSIPLDYVLDRANDVLLAYEMNDTKLPADHGFPVRLLIPGFVGGRSVKWLARIWISDEENQSYYHIWDNRVLPAFIIEKDGAFATTMFHYPSTKCMEQNLNSVIVHPGQGEKLNIHDLLKKDTYRIEWYAYDGGGHEVQLVEISLDHGKSWLYSIRTFPDRPIRNGDKFWTWLHWHVDIESTYLLRAESIVMRCFNVFKNTQPEERVWNVMGMMNNGWYTVKPETTKDGELMFRHPFHQEDNEGWMKPSAENSWQLHNRFTRQEIEKHSSKDDCWLAINNNVYDATSVLSWHPGGSATLLANAGKLCLDVTSSFESIHDDYAHKKLQEYIIGKATDKAVKFMQEQAKEEAERASKGGERKTFLQAKKWVPVKLVNKEPISEDTFTYTFSYAEEDSREFAAEYDEEEDQMSGTADMDDEKKDEMQSGEKANKNKNRNEKQGKHHKPLGLNTCRHKPLGLNTCQHIQFGIHMLDKLLIRSYTPTRPITENEEDGTFDLTVKTYFPDENQPGGAFNYFLYELEIGEQVEVCGPTGENTYLGMGKFNIEGREKSFNKISLVLGGSGVMPGYFLIKRVSEELASDDNKDGPEVRTIDANKTEDDILLHDDLNKIGETSKRKIQTTFVLSHPGNKDKWEKNGGFSGHVDEDMIKHKLFEPGDKSVVFLCGPPAMIQKAALPALKDWGYEEDENCFGF